MIVSQVLAATLSAEPSFRPASSSRSNQPSCRPPSTRHLHRPGSNQPSHRPNTTLQSHRSASSQPSFRQVSSLTPSHHPADGGTPPTDGATPAEKSSPEGASKSHHHQRQHHHSHHKHHSPTTDGAACKPSPPKSEATGTAQPSSDAASYRPRFHPSPMRGGMSGGFGFDEADPYTSTAHTYRHTSPSVRQAHNSAWK